MDDHPLLIEVSSDADGGLRISPTGIGDPASVLDLREAVLSGLRAEVPRVEVDLREVSSIDPEAVPLLIECAELATRLAIEFRVTGCRGSMARLFVSSGRFPTVLEPEPAHLE